MFNWSLTDSTWSLALEVASPTPSHSTPSPYSPELLHYFINLDDVQLTFDRLHLITSTGGGFPPPHPSTLHHTHWGSCTTSSILRMFNWSLTKSSWSLAVEVVPPSHPSTPSTYLPELLHYEYFINLEDVQLIFDKLHLITSALEVVFSTPSHSTPSPYLPEILHYFINLEDVQLIFDRLHLITSTGGGG